MLYEYIVQYFGTVTVLFPVSLFVFVVYCAMSIRKSYSDLPPGPRSYPIIGNVLDVKGKELGAYFELCREKYGDVFCLRFFHKLVIVINGHEAIKDALINNGQFFSDRPSLPFTKDEGIVFASGEDWKINRRFTLQTLRDFGMGRNALQVKIHEEIEAILHEIEQHKGEAFDIRPLLSCAVANIICSIIFGKRFTYDDDQIHDHVERLNVVTADTSIFFGSRILRYIPGDPFGMKAYLHTLGEIENFYKKIIERHLAEYDENSTKDLIDVYIKQMDVTNPERTGVESKKHQLFTIVSDLVGAGSETTATSLKWGVIYLLNNPKIQDRLYRELQENVSPDELPNVRDKLKLPFVEATVMEILRLGNIVPFSVPHATSRDCTFRGFTIPKDALILPNLQSVLYDPVSWDNPLQFRPERFISEDGVFQQKEDMIPFSLGRRSCLGESLARMELFLFFSAMVQHFEFLPPEGEDPPSLHAILGVVRAPKPFMMRAIKRKRD